MEQRKPVRRRRRSVAAPILFIIVLMLAAIIGMLVYKMNLDQKKSVYQYIDVSDEAAARALVWLSDIDDNGLTYDDIKNCMGTFNLEIVLTPNGRDGMYTPSVSEESYENCYSLAQKGLEKAFILSVKNRLYADGFEGEVSDEYVESLMSDAYGVSVSEYLKQCNVNIFPGLTEIREKYSEDVKFGVMEGNNED